jgi:WD40 repeat protein
VSPQRGRSLFLALLVLVPCLPLRAAAPPARKPSPGKIPRTDLYGDPLPRGAVARLGTVRWRAVEGIGSMAFAPDGKHLAAAWLSAWTLWDLRSGRAVRTVRDTFTPLERAFSGGFTFSPHGKRFLSRDVLLGKGSHLFRDLRGREPRLFLWDYPSGTLLAQSPELGGEPVCQAIRPDGRMAACGTFDGHVLLWDPGKNKLRKVIHGGHNGSLRGLAFSRNGKQLVVVRSVWQGGKDVRLIDIASGKQLRRMKLRATEYAVVSPAGGMVANYDEPGQLYLYDVSTGKRRRLGPKVKEDWRDLSFGCDGRTLLAMDQDAETVQFWDVVKGKLVRQIRVPGLARVEHHTRLCLSPDGQTLAARDVSMTSVRLWDARTGRPRSYFPGHSWPPDILAFSPDGRELLSLGHEAQASPIIEVFRWDVATGKSLGQVMLEGEREDFPNRNHRWLLAPGGRGLAVCIDKKIQLYDLRTGKRTILPTSASDHTIWAFAPDGRNLVTSSLDQKVRFWDAQSGKLSRLREYGSWSAAPAQVRVSSDGRLRADFDSETVRLYERATDQVVYSFPGRYSGTAFAPSGWRLATGCCDDGSILIWDLLSLFRSQGPSVPPSPEALWRDLCGEAPGANYAAWQLVTLPGADRFIARHLPPVERVGRDQLRRLLSDLGRAEFAVREKAEQALTELGDAARAAVEEANRTAKDVETRLRLKRLRARLEARAPLRLREVRAIMVLEARGTPAARALLRRLAAGMAEARLTREAKAAVRRLDSQAKLAR